MSRFRKRRRAPFRRNRRRGPLKSLARARSSRGNLNKRLRKIELTMENKTLDINQIFTPGTAGSIKFLNGIPVGTDEKERIGKKISPVHMQGNILVRKDAVNTGGDRMRIIFFIDKQFTGTNPPAVTDVLELSLFNSIRNQKNFGRFKILIDKKINLQRTGDGKTTFWFPFFTRFASSFVINYLGNGSSQAEGGLNSLFLLMLGEEGIDTTSVELVYRLTYKDS